MNPKEKKMSGCNENPYVGRGNEAFNPEEVRLYGRTQVGAAEKEASAASDVSSDGRMLHFRAGDTAVLANLRLDTDLVSIGIIYGYSYEGHCYKLAKPRIMYIPAHPQQIAGGDSCCDCGYSPDLGYVVWTVDKLDHVVALDVRSDDVKSVVLEENMPGTRSPQAYAQVMVLAPQRSRD